MRAITRRLIGLKISIVLLPGRLITTCPLAIATWLNPGSPGRSTMANWRSLAAKPAPTQVRTNRRTGKVNLSLRIGEPVRVVGCGEGLLCCPGSCVHIPNPAAREREPYGLQ